jgi:V/A-type H+-transporting ATPase subunit A
VNSLAINSVIFGINGPVVTIKDATDFSMQEMVYVGHERLVGEVISISDKLTTIQVYEVTTGLKPGEPITGTGSPMSVTLGPGIVSNIFDGIQRPLRLLEQQSGSFISRGNNAPPLDDQRLWDVTITVKIGDKVSGGTIYATCEESSDIIHKCMISPIISGEVISAKPNGQYKIYDDVIEVKDQFGKIYNINLTHRWPIRVPRPSANRIPIDRPLITGQRIIDTLYPIAKGGVAAIPGGFGTGKTMTQHQLAKWCDADLIVYIGCGERGNEMTQVLEEFSELIDPKSNRPLTDRTVLIANTSNMPVAAREASIYTGITLAEYYRDMGYHVAIMADSTSRWAEALREISGRLEEMPAEEGFPAYLPSRLSQFYERAGYMQNFNGTEGSVSIIGAVSPQGSDFSEPVTQNTKRFTRCFWALDKTLAYARHYPAINWITSYSEYINDLKPWYNKNLGPKFLQYRNEIQTILHEEDKLMEIVKLIGADVLPDDQKLIIEIARVIRVGFLQQNAYHATDTYVPIEKQLYMMEIILHLYNKSKEIVASSIPISMISNAGLFEKLVKMKYDIPNDKPEMFEQYMKDIDEAFVKISQSKK